MNFPTVKLPGKAKLYRNIPKEEQNKHWIILDEIIESDYPEIYPVFLKHMYGNYTVWGNMFITTIDVYDEYCEFIFDIMRKYDRTILERGEEREPRVDGFLTEHLLLSWLNWKFKKRNISFGS